MLLKAVQDTRAAPIDEEAVDALAAILGMMPLAIGQGIGAELRNGVGIASVGGIFISGLLTLVVMPMLYDFSTRKQNSIKD